MGTTVHELQVEKAKSTRIHEVDFSDLYFGSEFTDHMFICEYKNGQWGIPRIQPYQPLTLHPSAKVFHYGQAVFEGMKAYKDDEGSVWLFRPDENLKRFNRSCKRMAIPEFPESYFFDGLTTLLQLDKEWAKPGIGNSLYERPFAIATQAGIKASPSEEYAFMIICSPAQGYYGGDDIRLQIAEHYSRAADGGIGYAKAAGNYAAQFYPTSLAQQEGYQQVIWTDAQTHEYIEEAGTMNVFIRLDDTLVTCPTSDRILDGITRKSVITMAEDLGIPVEIRPIKVSELVEGIASGRLKELFGSGTAAIISPATGFSYQGKEYDMPVIQDSYATRIKARLMDIQYNRAEDKYGWRYKVT